MSLNLLTGEFNPEIPLILPHDKVYSIQVGNKLFRLSGLSLSSDAPSYFTQYFDEKEREQKQERVTNENENECILFIDRNPMVFEKIYNHLQGYHVTVDNDNEFMNIWLDSFYFGLKRLQRLLNEENYFCNIGSVSFKFSRKLLMKPGDDPNYFSIHRDSLLTDNKKIIESKNMLRPPPQTSATVANRSPLLFGDLIEILKGNHLVIRNDKHRELLVKECKYYGLLGLQQTILKHKIMKSFNCKTEQIILNLFDLNKRGLTFQSTSNDVELPLTYSRPYLNEFKRTLIFQLNNDSPFDPELKLVINKTEKIASIQLTGKFRTKFLQLFRDVKEGFVERSDGDKLIVLVGLKDSKAKLNNIEMRDDWYSIFLGLNTESDIRDAPALVQSYKSTPASVQSNTINDSDLNVKSKRRKLSTSVNSNESAGDDNVVDIIEITLVKSLWRIMSRGNHTRLHAVSLEGITDEKSFMKNTIDFI